MQIHRIIRKMWPLSMAMVMIFFFTSQSFAQVPPGQFTRYWRNFFSAKASWPTLRVAAAQGEYLYGMGIATLVGTSGIAGAAVGLGLVGQIENNLNAAMAGVGLNPPESPKIISLERTPQGVDITFSDFLNSQSRLYTYQLIHFENANAKPRLVANLDNASPGKWVLTDNTPPQSGVSFYAMTATRGVTYSPTQVMTPWWSIPMSGSNVAYFLWLSGNKFGITSDYSAPMPYNAAAAPILGNVDSIAVSPDTGDVYVSRPITRQITKMQNTGIGLGPEKPFISIPYKDPGQKGLAIDGTGNLYTDNSASDSQFGGRLFKFNASNAAMVFSGTVNYFSQMLMYANPVMVGPMVMGTDDQLYVYENMSSTIKAVPVNATYDPYRRVGQNLYTFSGNQPRDVIDMEYLDDVLSNNIYVLHGQGISRISSDPVTATKSIESIPLE